MYGIKIDPKLQEAVLDIIADKKAHAKTGNLDGEESLSALISELRYKGWKISGNAVDFEYVLNGNGFKLREQRVGKYGMTRRIYVGI